MELAKKDCRGRRSSDGDGSEKTVGVEGAENVVEETLQ